MPEARTRLHGPRTFALLTAVAGIASTSLATESPSFSVDVVQDQILYTATPAASTVPGFKPHINFPFLSKRGNGSFVLWWTVGQTNGVGNFGLGSTSANGSSWTAPNAAFPFMPPIHDAKPAGQTSRGFVINMSSPTGTSTWNHGRYLSSDGGVTWAQQSSGSNYDTLGVNYLSMYQNPGSVVQIGATTLISAFGQRPGLNTFELVLFASTDGGQNFVRRATVADYIAGNNTSMGEEGPNESDIIRLNNGQLMAVFRTGQPFPNADLNATTPSIFFSHSADEGVTWTSPKMLGVMGAFPHVHKLDDGSIAMTYGRAGDKIMFADPTGKRWSKPTSINSTSSSGYVRMHRRDSDGKWLYAYDQSSFYPPGWNGSAPSGYIFANDTMANMRVATLDIKPVKTFDYYPWATRYDGDVTPDQLPEPWTPTLSGAVSAYQWADLGQDYLRTDSGGTGTSRAIFYTLPGGGSTSWTPMDFALGTVIEMRARAGSVGTAEGSASIFAGDGTNGFVSLEITGNAVNLEGLGGNGSQVVLNSTTLPGFDPKAWHDYRLVIAPLDSAGGAIRAQLFLDGNLYTPVLTQSLLPSSVNEIRFGDQTGTNNGVLDLDYLRFGTRANQWKSDVSGTWHDPARWSTSVPNAASSTAYLLQSIRNSRTITLDAPATIGNLVFDNPSSYTISGTQLLTFDAPGGSNITLVTGNHSVLAPMRLNNATRIQGTGDLTARNITNLASLSIELDMTAKDIDGGGSITIASGASLRAERVVADAVVANGALRIDAHPANLASRVSSLTLAAGVSLDLNEALVVDYTGASPESTLRNLLLTGYSLGTWTGPGIRSSTAAASGLTIGHANAADLFSSFPATYGGVTIDSTTIIVALTIAGDANLDRTVDFTDLLSLAQNYNSPGQWSDGDFNYSQFVEFNDLLLLAQNYGASALNANERAILGESFASDWELARSLVPEPTVSLASSAGLLCFAGRRRRSAIGL